MFPRNVSTVSDRRYSTFSSLGSTIVKRNPYETETVYSSETFIS